MDYTLNEANKEFIEKINNITFSTIKKLNEPLTNFVNKQKKLLSVLEFKHLLSELKINHIHTDFEKWKDNKNKLVKK